MTAAAAALQAAARSAAAELRSHKQAQRHHRDGARAAKARLAQLEAECAQRGIRLVLAPNQ